MHNFKTRRAIRRLSRLWISTALSTNLKLRLFINSLVLSILSYNATTWTMDSCQGSQNRLLRDAINIRWSPGVHQQTNATIYDANHLQPFATILRRRRLLLLSKLRNCSSTCHGRPLQR